MKRIDALRYIVKHINDELVICNLGFPCKELYSVKDAPTHFYMLGSIGLASSIGLGLSIAVRRKVVVIDGDGSLLYNLGSLMTVAMQRPGNLYWIVLDNESHGSTGFQPTYDATVANLGKLAQAAGLTKVQVTNNKSEFEKALQQLKETGPLFLIVKVEEGNAKVNPIPVTPDLIKSRFMEEVKKG